MTLNLLTELDVLIKQPLVAFSDDVEEEESDGDDLDEDLDDELGLDGDDDDADEE